MQIVLKRHNDDDRPQLYVDGKLGRSISKGSIKLCVSKLHDLPISAWLESEIGETLHLDFNQWVSINKEYFTHHQMRLIKSQWVCVS